jgi:hypothetical protein
MNRSFFAVTGRIAACEEIKSKYRETDPGKLDGQLPVGPVELHILMPHGIAQNHAATSSRFPSWRMIAAKQWVS